jgi:hypothetical protein
LVISVDRDPSAGRPLAGLWRSTCGSGPVTAPAYFERPDGSADFGFESVWVDDVDGNGTPDIGVPEFVPGGTSTVRLFEWNAEVGGLAPGGGVELARDYARVAGLR